MKIWIDGRLHDKEDAKISVFDHGLLYGDGIFEGIRAYNGRIFMLREHVKRLFNSAKGILLQPLWSEAEVEALILETVRQNGLRDAYIRVVMTRGAGDLGLDMRKCKKPSLIIIADKIELYPEEVYSKGLAIITSSLRRLGPDQLSPNIKSLNYLNNILARAEAVRANSQEAILLNPQGFVAECTGDNIFFLQDGKVYTPPPWAGILEGVTRASIIQLLKDKLDTPVVEEMFTPFQLYRADEVFLTGTGAEVVPVCKVDGRAVGTGKPGMFTHKLMQAFRQHVSRTGTPIYEEVKVK